MEIEESENIDQASSDKNILAEKVADTDQPFLSKNQRKRILKAEIWQLHKKLKKERKKKTKVDSNQLTAEIPQIRDPAISEKRREDRAKEKLHFMESCDSNFCVAIDCGWEDDHNEKALKSLKQQIIYCYGYNKKQSNPCHIHVTNSGGKMNALFSKNHVDKLIAFHVHEEDHTQTITNKELIYLTSDGDEVLSSLDTNCCYIIGGIVDRNRLKKATLNKAKQQGIRSARLPIKEYCELSATSVLTVNHVFEILLQFQKTGSWQDTFRSVLPSRKEVHVKGGDTDTAGGEGERSGSNNLEREEVDDEEEEEEEEEDGDGEEEEDGDGEGEGDGEGGGTDGNGNGVECGGGDTGTEAEHRGNCDGESN